MNSVSIVGRVVGEPELRQTPSGAAVCNLRLAVDRAGMKTDAGIGAGFFGVTLWGKTATVASARLTNGCEVAIEGELRWREWEQDDAKRQAVEINGRTVTFVGVSQQGTASGAEQEQFRSPIPKARRYERPTR
jgi:single-strand DNA-binding protein